MTALLAAEGRRLLSTRIWLWGLLAAVASGGFVALLALVGPENFDPPMPGLHTEPGTRLLLGFAGILAFVPALLGTTAVTTEYRHQTITFTYLFAPRRWTVLAAKLGVYGIAGLVYGIVTVITLGAGLFAAAAVHGVSLGLPTASVVGLLLRIAMMLGVYTVLGAAFGALLRNQVAALLVVGMYFYIGETALLLIPGVNAVYPFLPGGASAALTGFTYLAAAAGEAVGSATHLLSAPLGALVLLGYAAVAACLALAAPLRRDVT
jgi:ABC-type transport system involved in multi-copper enzyme maturation permease subunit